MRLLFVSGYLLRALRWLERMRLALMQARRWLSRGFGLLSLPCYRDAWQYGRLAGQDLRCWREAVVLSWLEMPISDLEVLP